MDPQGRVGEVRGHRGLILSSAGPTLIRFDTFGAPTGPVLRQKPEIVAPDGGNNTFFGADYVHATDTDTDPNFFGTSAAAPGAAGVAALMKQANAALLPAGIYAALETTALDMVADNSGTRSFAAGPLPGGCRSADHCGIAR